MNEKQMTTWKTDGRSNARGTPLTHDDPAATSKRRCEARYYHITGFGDMLVTDGSDTVMVDIEEVPATYTFSRYRVRSAYPGMD